MRHVRVLGDPWPQLVAAAEASRGDVAVAYVGQGAAELLPLRASSILVVDASEGAVKSGQTDPRELLKYVRRGVEVFSQPGLHAKVFAFTNRVFVGSTNVSHRSSEFLVEASIEVKDKGVVADAKQFVWSLATSPVGEGFLERLVKLYRPPRVQGRPQRRSSKRGGRLAGATALRVVQQVREKLNEPEEQATRAALRAARSRRTSGFTLETFQEDRVPSLSSEEEVLVAITESDGRTVTLWPPGRPLAASRVGRRKSWRIAVELPDQEALTLAEARARLPSRLASRLRRGGRLTPQHAAAVRHLWH